MVSKCNTSVLFDFHKLVLWEKMTILPSPNPKVHSHTVQVLTSFHSLCNCHLPSKWGLFNLKPFPSPLTPSLISFSPSKVLWHLMINLSSIIRMGAPGGKCSCQLFDLLFFQHLKHYLGHRRSLCVFPGRASHGASRKARWRHIKKIYQLIDINIGFCIV